MNCLYMNTVCVTSVSDSGNYTRILGPIIVVSAHDWNARVLLNLTDSLLRKNTGFANFITFGPHVIVFYLQDIIEQCANYEG